MQLRTLVLLGAALLAQDASSAPALLDVRDVHNCKGPFQCRNFPRPDNSFATCVGNVCGWQCSDAYVSAGRTCNLIPASSASSVLSFSSVSSASSDASPAAPSKVTLSSAAPSETPSSSTTSKMPTTTPVGVVGPPQTTQPASTSPSSTSAKPTTTTTLSTKAMAQTLQTTTTSSSSSSTTQPPPATTEAPPPPTTTTSAAPTTTEPPTPTITLIPNAVAAAGVTGFAGDNTNAIISWFRADSSQDSTNGHSWNAVPGFAPSLNTMLSNFNWDYEAAATAYCGLEAVITTPDGLTATLYIADAFDDTWVRTPASIDVMYDSFASLYGSVTTNKNDVVKDGSWYLTGNRNERYKFKGLGSVGL